jgi:outer membrane protein TolC
LFALTLPLAGCSDLQDQRIDLPLPPAVQNSSQPQGDWWLAAGDPVLAHLVPQGLSGTPALACEAAGLAGHENGGILHTHRARVIDGEAGYRYVEHRAHTAAAIAHAYVDLRKWQSLLALRTGVLDQYRDNAEIARFRREAGLVSAVDGGLAGALTALSDSTQDRTRARLDVAFVTLSSLVGIPPAELKAQLGEGTAIPDLGPGPAKSPASDTPDISASAGLLALHSHLERRLSREKVSQARLDQALADLGDAQPTSPAQAAVAAWRRALLSAEAEIRTFAAAVAVADTRLQALLRHDAGTQRAVADARLAYRAGLGDFATLFVAEVAALGLRETMVEAHADRSNAMIDLRTARGEGWSPDDLAPAAIAEAAARKGADCE